MIDNLLYVYHAFVSKLILLVLYSYCVLADLHSISLLFYGDCLYNVHTHIHSDGEIRR